MVGQGKDRLHHRLVAAGAYQVAGRPVAEDEVHGIDDDGFARPRLARNDVQAAGKGHRKLIDNGKIAYGKVN